MSGETQQPKPKPKLSDRGRRLLKLRMERSVKFVRQESWRYARVDENWRKPRGVSSKMRRRMRGWPRIVSIGYGSPRIVRGLHPSGFREVLVYREEDLEGLDPERDAVRIAHTVGMRKRRAILDKARKLGLKVLNPGVVVEVGVK
ncbi:MAG: 50S ribosomal protein L32e [Candidatus Bathyarchaeia archaeon]